MISDTKKAFLQKKDSNKESKQKNSNLETESGIDINNKHINILKSKPKKLGNFEYVARVSSSPGVIFEEKKFQKLFDSDTNHIDELFKSKHNNNSRSLSNGIKMS
jgi:hypothetical protein